MDGKQTMKLFVNFLREEITRLFIQNNKPGKVTLKFEYFDFKNGQCESSDRRWIEILIFNLGENNTIVYQSHETTKPLDKIYFPEPGHKFRFLNIYGSDFEMLLERFFSGNPSTNGVKFSLSHSDVDFKNIFSIVTEIKRIEREKV